MRNGSRTSNHTEKDPPLPHPPDKDQHGTAMEKSRFIETRRSRPPRRSPTVRCPERDSSTSPLSAGGVSAPRTGVRRSRLSRSRSRKATTVRYS
ncbi:hypothetical protein GWI33_001996 [Rhynchophorus ferrugineus]|uniref:Uncharacterized protein n=1 Tax=Rhynchophorus ferrugineus TaxID=354439 RepID=A0A834IPW0_RHYFE|nr:hypothetical protein GWI33_001996 [Rhynchophorus ferrugineus]